MSKRNLREHFKEGWNKILGKKQDRSKLRSKSLFRAINGIQNVGTPHDWEDYEKYKKEIDKDESN